MANEVNYRDPTANNFPQDYDPAKVDPRVKLRSDSIKHKQKGVDTREGIYQALEIGSVTANEAKTTAINTASRQDDVELSQSDFEDRYNDQIAGNTDLDEVIDSRKPKSKESYATLGKRLDDMPMNADLELLVGDSLQDVDGGIPEYMNQTLDEASASIDSRLFNLGFGTDYHYDVASDYDPHNSASPNLASAWASGLRKSLNMLSLSTNLDAVVFGGDNTDQPSDVYENEKEVMLKEQRDFATTAFTYSKAPVFLLKGNHDCNYNNDRKLESIITDKELAPIYGQDRSSFGEVRDGNSNYFYLDFPSKKIRLIGLDSYDLPETVVSGVMKYNRFKQSGFQQAQIDWLASKALQVDSDWTVLIVIHCPIDTIFNVNTANKINHNIVKKILEDFITGGSATILGSVTDVPVNVSYEFKSGGHLSAVLSGHEHLDKNKIVNGINYVETRCSLTAGDEVIKAKRMDYFGTVLEDAFDVVSIDSINKKILFKRIGAGSEDSQFANREFEFK